LTVKLPDEQKQEIEGVAEKRNYNSTSEYVREALRDKVEEDLELKPELVEELHRRLQRYEEGETDGLSLEELDEKLGLSK